VSRSLRLPAPAKVTLGLRILGRRIDGYHELESLFAPLDLADALQLEIARADVPRVTLRVEPTGSGAPADASNLAARAAELFLAEARLALRVEIALEKRTPVGAGLGGGSSDAGAVLRGLASFAPDALTPERLAALALRLGADVPFFLDPRPAFVRGIGERVEPVAGLPALALVLANPGEPLATREVYRVYDVLQPGSQRAALDLPRELPRLLADRSRLASLLHNDLEQAALRLCPAVRRLRGELSARGALAVGMSGSGPTVFGVFESGAAARSAAQRPLAAPAWLRVATTAESG
jgi:4-diphosphocytidyl-2-C-methyl-D-erythritol kinase